jgi:hypothetical protein
MHACLLHIYNHALLYLSCLLFILEDRSWLCARAIFVKSKDRSFVTLTSSVRLCSVLHFEAPKWFLVCWQIASYSYMSSHMAFLATNMELFGTTRQVPRFGILVGPTEDHVWFEDRWMVASWCDE